MNFPHANPGFFLPNQDGKISSGVLQAACSRRGQRAGLALCEGQRQDQAVGLEAVLGESSFQGRCGRVL